MTCVHKVRWSVKRPEDCRFRLSVSHYKDRIVAPDEYSGVTVVTPSDVEQVLPTKDKLVRDDITVNPAPTEVLSTDHNGTFTPSDGRVGFSQVNVDVQPVLESLSVDPLTQHGVFTPASGIDGFSQVTVEDDWDGSLVPDENGTGFFHCKHITLLATDILIIEGYGTGYDWASAKSNQPDFVVWGRQYGTGAADANYARARIWLVPTDDTTAIIGAAPWVADNVVYPNNYAFKGEYLRWKVIHAT